MRIIVLLCSVEHNSFIYPLVVFNFFFLFCKRQERIEFGVAAGITITSGLCNALLNAKPQSHVSLHSFIVPTVISMLLCVSMRFLAPCNYDFHNFRQFLELNASS